MRRFRLISSRETNKSWNHSSSPEINQALINAVSKLREEYDQEESGDRSPFRYTERKSTFTCSHISHVTGAPWLPAYVGNVHVVQAAFEPQID